MVQIYAFTYTRLPCVTARALDRPHAHYAWLRCVCARSYITLHTRLLHIPHIYTHTHPHTLHYPILLSGDITPECLLEVTLHLPHPQCPTPEVVTG